MNSRPPRDAEYRQHALQVDQSMIVQAPAGSGKTTLLVQRYLSLLATVERPEQVVVITFTRKATGELRDRVLAALEQAATGSQCPGDLLTEPAARVLARDAEKNWELLQMPSRLGIYTIDALCAVLVRQIPWLAGLGGLARIEEHPQRFYQQAADNVLAGLNVKRAADPDLVRVFEHLDNDLASMRGLLMRMLARREQWTPYLQPGAQSATGLRESLQQGLALIIEGQLSLLNSTLPADCRSALQELVVAVAEGLGNEGNASALAGIKALPGAAAEDLPAWRTLAGMLLTAKNDSLRKRDLKPQALQGLDKETRREINARARILLPELARAEAFARTLLSVASLPDAAFTEIEWRLLVSLLEVLKIALAELRLIFAREGSVDFSEITHAALQALGPDDAPTDLGLVLDYRIQHLLVDEFQDTSRAHYELVKRLSAGFTGDDGRSLFLVGDPMQSIYRFREAEVGLFLDCMQGAMADIDLHHLLLEANFRSRPALVAWVNETFAEVFPATHDAARSCVAYAPAQAQRSVSTDAAVTLHGFLDAENFAQAQRVAEIVSHARQAHSQHSIAVLVRSRAHLELILPALRAAGLRYRGVDIEPLATLPVVRDLHALTRALLQPADRMSWLALLHSPWCGLQLADLYALFGDNWETCVPVLLDDNVRRGRLGKASRERLDSFLEALAGARKATQSVRLKRRVEACWIAFGGPGICAPDQVRDALRYFELLDTLEADGSRLDLDRLARRLDDLYAGPQSGEADLDVMTMHKAKGLEFDQVIVPYLEKQPRAADPPLLQWSEVAFPGGSALVFAAKPAAGEDSHRYPFVTALEANKQRNESARLLYVACTRAREQLHLLYGLKSGTKEALRSPAKNSLLAHLWPVLQEQLEAQLETENADEALQPPLDPGGSALTRLSRGWRMPAMGEALDWCAGMEMAESGSGADLEFDWAGQTARHVGTVVHRLLGEIAVLGPAAWSARRVADQLPDIARELEHLGVPAAQSKAAGGQVVEALVKTLADDRGRWLLAADHLDASCELPLCGLIAGRVHSVFLDRSFVDVNNVRWIIDYKTGRHGGADLEGFLDVEKQRYASQLQRYGEIMQHLDPRPIRLGLYFPLVSGWRDWAFRRVGT